jgi:hypothetical protein
MSLNEFRTRLTLITEFTQKISQDATPYDIQRVMIKSFANALRINLTDKMLDDIV